MILTSHSHHLFAISHSTYSLCFTRNCTISLTCPTTHPRLFKSNSFRPQRLSSFRTRPDPFLLKAYESESAVQNPVFSDFSFDSLLSLAELSCLLSSAIVLVSFAVNGAIAGSKNGFLVAMCNNRVVFVCGVLMLMGGLSIGTWIRRRQWRRICGERVNGGSLEVNLIQRIEKLEEESRNSVTFIRVLSRQIEKLGTRFRVTRHNLKDPITETAALAQRNSEATRALAVQSDILEKELGEIQKVLLAMQEQQQKQLDLILAIGKIGKLWESKLDTSGEHDALETPNKAEDMVKQEEVYQI